MVRLVIGREGGMGIDGDEAGDADLERVMGPEMRRRGRGRGWCFVYWKFGQ